MVYQPRRGLNLLDMNGLDWLEDSLVSPISIPLNGIDRVRVRRILEGATAAVIEDAAISKHGKQKSSLP